MELDGTQMFGSLSNKSLKKETFNSSKNFC